MSTLTLIVDQSNKRVWTNHIDLSKHHISSILSVNINGLLSKFYYNTATKSIQLLHVVEKGDHIVITYHPDLSELRDKQLKVLGI